VVYVFGGESRYRQQGLHYGGCRYTTIQYAFPAFTDTDAIITMPLTARSRGYYKEVWGQAGRELKFNISWEEAVGLEWLSL